MVGKVQKIDLFNYLLFFKSRNAVWENGEYKRREDRRHPTPPKGTSPPWSKNEALVCWLLHSLPLQDCKCLFFPIE
jgi:hypothetical protein